MIGLIRSEWIKLRTVTSHWVLAVIGVAFTPVVGVLTALFVTLDSNTEPSLPTEVTVGTVVVMGLLFGTIGVLSFAQEQSHGTIRVTYAAEPRRPRVLVAKALVLSVAALVLSAVTIVATYVAMVVIMDQRGDGPAFTGDATEKSALIGAVVLVVLLTLLGFALGMLLRSAPLAITIFIVWPLLAEGLIGALLSLVAGDAVWKWLPYQSGFQLTAVGVNDSDMQHFGRVASGAYFGLWVAVILALGAWQSDRRDA